MTHPIAQRLSIRAETLRQQADRLAEEAAQAEADAVEVLRLAAGLSSDPNPAPEPEPAAPAEPEPEPQPTNPVPDDLHVMSLGNGAKMLTFSAYHQGGAGYIRGQTITVLAGHRATLRLHRTTMSGGAQHWPARDYPLFVGGVPVGMYRFSEGGTWAQIAFNAAGLPGGWQLAEVAGAADGEVCVPWHVYVDHGQDKPGTMPVHEGSHKTPTDPTHGVHAWKWAPATYAPTLVPLVKRAGFPAVEASTPVHADLMTRGERGVNISLPATTKTGLVCSHWLQSYFWYSQLERWPMLPLMNGPRGYGTHPLVTHIEVGAAAPDGVPRNTFYFATPWSIVRGEETGNTTCLLGYEHEVMPSYAGDQGEQSTLRLRGDWSAVPEDRRGLWGVRSFAWDEASLAVDETLPRVEGELGAPHPVGPVLYIAEQRASGNGVAADGRILRAQFSGQRHGVLPVITELATGLSGPWGVVDYGEEIIVSERNASRIIAIRKSSGTHRVIAQGDAAMATVGAKGLVSAAGSLPARRDQPCLAPECLKVQDGWLYYGSRAAESVKRLDLATGQVEADYLLPVKMARQSWFVEFAVSDGTFGPRGTIYAATWGQSDYPAAYGIQPDGQPFKAHSGAAPWAQSQGYPCAVAAGHGRLYVASSNLGITRFGAAQPGDVAPDAGAWRRAEYEWDAAHGNLRWGSYGFGDHGHPLPWGQSADIDHMLTILGHQRPK